MRAAFFEGPRTFTVRPAPVPEPGPGEVRLRVRYCGVCGSDVSLFKTGALAGPGVVLGHEVSAAVDLDPAGAWGPGTRVVLFPGRGCGRCVWCREGKFRYCLDPPDGGTYGGGFAEFCTAPAGQLVPVPEGVDDRAAALAEPLAVALRAVGLAEAGPGDLAYVSGLGSLGLLSVAALREAGCRVVGADPREERRALGEELGCERVMDPTEEDPGAVTTSLDPHGPRVALECAGAPDSLQQVVDACGPGGVVGILGVPMGPVSLLRMTLRELRSFSIQGPSFEALRAALELLGRRPELLRVVTDVVGLEDLPRAMARLADGQGPSVKVLVSPSG
ncbi:MAG TPA: alcohol dehydrogenase catalytic domain-containing protein [Actinomycetota bacterium]|nr:alcohol dehydrogenase catalytic domain-containing protein [Actinomycetota bacterium]